MQSKQPDLAKAVRRLRSRHDVGADIVGPAGRDQPKQDKAAALRLMRKLLKKQGYAPRVLVTDKQRSEGCARRELDLSARHQQGLHKNNRAENSHQPVR